MLKFCLRVSAVLVIHWYVSCKFLRGCTCHELLQIFVLVDADPDQKRLSPVPSATTVLSQKVLQLVHPSGSSQAGIG